MVLVPLIDNFEAAKNAIKVQSDAEQKIVDSYQVRTPLSQAAGSMRNYISTPWLPALCAHTHVGGLA